MKQIVPRLTATETLHSYTCDQCEDRVTASQNKPATVYAVLIQKRIGNRYQRHKLCCSEDCGEAALVVSGLEELSA